MAYRKEDIVRGLDTSFPDQVMTVQITKMEKKTSQAGNAMIVTDIEISEPTHIEVAGRKIQTGGLQGRMFGMLDPNNPFGLAKLIAGLDKAGLSPTTVQGLDDETAFEENNLKPFVGKYMRMVVSCEVKKAFRKPTAEEAAAGIKTQELVDPATGKTVILGYQLKTDWSNVFGPGTAPETF
jgi:hypothetical protein